MNSFQTYGLIVLITIIWGCAGKEKIVKQPETTPPEQQAGTYFWAVKPEINIRAQNSTAAAKLGKLNDGDSVLVLENKDGWYRIQHGNNTFGWIRSDLLGPKKISVFAKAVTFVDSLQTNHGTELYFDKTLLHKRIYLAYPPEKYTSKDQVKIMTEKLVADYQKKVYRGDVAARVLVPATQEEYITINKPGKINAHVTLPVLPFGILGDVDSARPENIALSITIPDKISDTQLMDAARKIVSVYPISYSRVSVLFISQQDQCRLWFVEDENGENYQLNKCPE